MKNKQYLTLIFATFFCATLLYISLVAILTLQNINPIFDYRINGIEYPDTELAKTVNNVNNNKRDSERK